MTYHNAHKFLQERDDFLRASYRREADELTDDITDVALALPAEDSAQLFGKLVEAFQTVATKNPAVEHELRVQQLALWTLNTEQRAAIDPPEPHPETGGHSLDADVAGALAAIADTSEDDEESAKDAPDELVEAVSGPRPRRRGRKT